MEYKPEDPLVEFLYEKHKNTIGYLHLEIGNRVRTVQVQHQGDKNHFEWEMYVEPSNHEMVEYVEYVLHHTFSPSKIRLTDAPYSLTRTGWGEFQIQVAVKLRGVPDVLRTTHDISLSKNSSRTEELKLPKTFEKRMPDVEEVELFDMHGRLGREEWAAPIIAVECNTEARPGYASMKAHEYEDDPETLSRKIKVLAGLIRKSTNMIAYTGAGISTSSGIDDYASKAKNSKMNEGRKKVKSAFEAEPSLGHRTLTALFNAGYLKHWVQQNHDGLPQKAGFPQEHINEIHGAWYDPSNPVVPMSGSLRGDLFSWMKEWQRKSDFCIAMGTSLCGMSADDCVTKCAVRKNKYNKGCGSVIVGLQRTQYDSQCAIRIFAKIDDVCALLAREMKIIVPPLTKYKPSIPKECIVEPHLYKVPYDADGNLTTDKEKQVLWDLRPGAKLVITNGPGKGFVGQVSQCADEESLMYWCRLPFQREGANNHGKGFANYALGGWWVQAAAHGRWRKLPVANTKENLGKQDPIMGMLEKRLNG